MKKILFISFIFCFSFLVGIYANEPDSAYIFAYEKHNGLSFAWSIDKKAWHPIGSGFSFVRSDYGRWGSEKRMLSPVLLQNQDGWHAVWSLNERDGAFAYAFSKNLIDWQPQSYSIVSDENCLNTKLTYKNGLYTISWESKDNENTPPAYYAVSTSDFKTYSKAIPIQQVSSAGQRVQIFVSDEMEMGTIHRVSWNVIDDLENKVARTNYRNGLFGEKTMDDAIRFADLKPINVTINILVDKTKNISDKLLGIFFEDINYSADGGIYAELIQNRDFEYSSADRHEWNSKSFWQSSGNDVTLDIQTGNPIHPNNPHYAILTTNTTGGILSNEGFDGVVLKSGDKYDFSLFARTLEGENGKLKIRLTGDDGKIYSEISLANLGKDWKKYNAVLTANTNATNARLEIVMLTEGKIALDMVSLFPQKTFKNRKNGLRADLAQTLADLKPQFVRFPGGCVAHGDGIDNIYHWKNTIGALEARKPQRNLWGYHQTAGLGYYEYFQFCEDIQAEPIPIVAAGVPCQNSGHHGCPIGGQQGGMPMEDMDTYIQDIMDLVEWANGNPKTSKWAKMRADAGHLEPFNLKYIGVGNEDLISDIFEERFEMIYKALKEKHPEITVIGTAGPFSEGSDYVRGWEFATKLGVSMLDEHYYQPPGWFIYNQDYYDRYDRNKAKVYLGEYAAHLPDRPNNIETALSEAIHLITCERNGDVVEMTSYAPLLAKEGYTQWSPDLIYFDNSEVKPTVGYYVQQLFGQNAGTEYISLDLHVDNHNEKVRNRVACSVVKDNETDEIIIKLVNMLPVEVDTKLNADVLNTTSTNVIKTVLSGNSSDKSARPVESKTSVEEIQNMKLPAYSFSVLRIKNK